MTFGQWAFLIVMLLLWGAVLATKLSPWVKRRREASLFDQVLKEAWSYRNSVPSASLKPFRPLSELEKAEIISRWRNAMAGNPHFPICRVRPYTRKELDELYPGIIWLTPDEDSKPSAVATGAGPR